MRQKRLTIQFYLLILPLLAVNLLLASSGTVAAMSAAHANSPVVNTLADESDGRCDDGDCSLRDAIAAANSGDKITFNISGTIFLSPALGDLEIDKDITIDGGKAITINGGNALRIFNITAGSVVLDGLSITNGQTPIENCDVSLSCAGGGILVQNSGTALTVRDSVLSSNSAKWGGGILNDGGVVKVINSELTANTAEKHGGAVYNSDIGSITVENSRLTGNSAALGGAIFNDNEGEITGGNISGNTASGSGGGIYNDGNGVLQLTGSTLSNNVTKWNGGGIANHGTLNVSNSTFFENGVEWYGGAISNVGILSVVDSELSSNQAFVFGGAINNDWFGRADIKRSTLTENFARNDGGGISVINGLVNVTNSTLSGNTAVTGAGAIFIYYGAINLDSSTITLNHAGSIGGGIGSLSPNLSNIKSSIISNNTAGNSREIAPNDLAYFSDSGDPSTFRSGGHNVIGAFDETIDMSGPGDQIGLTDPGLEPLSDNGGPTTTHALLPDSPALDAGGSCGVAIDQRGISRPQGNACDTGAFESTGFEPIPAEKVFLPTQFRDNR